MIRNLSLVLCLVVPSAVLAQTSAGAVSPPPPPPPSYPPSYPPEPPPSYAPDQGQPPQAQPQPQPNLQPNLQPYGQPPPSNLRPYAPTPGATAQKESGPPEMVLASGEFLASVAVTVVSTVAVGTVLLNPSYAQAGELVLLLYLGVVPIASSLPVWLISLLSDRYDARLGPPIEAGSTVSGIALLLGLIGLVANSQGFLYLGGGLLVLGMPLAEVIALNLTKVPKGTGYFGQAPAPLYDAPPNRLALEAPRLVQPGTVMLALPALSF